MYVFHNALLERQKVKIIPVTSETATSKSVVLETQPAQILRDNYYTITIIIFIIKLFFKKKKKRKIPQTAESLLV